MTLSPKPILLFLVATACTMNLHKTQKYPSKGSLLVFDRISGQYIVTAADKQLIATWETFKQAVSASDYNTLKSISFNSIVCDICVSSGASATMTANTFYGNHASDLLSKSFSTRILDSSKVKCSYDLDSSYFYAHPVLSTVSDLAKRRLGVMFIEYPVSNRNSQGEHNSGLLGFLETRSGYKFFGYSTIP